MHLLLRTPDPADYEGIFGYVLRVSEANHYDTPWHVLSHAGYPQGEMLTAALDVGRLACVVGKEPGVLRRHAYQIELSGGRRSYGILGVPIGAGLSHGPLRFAKPAVCPDCIAETGYADACWDLSVFVACPRHRKPLTTACHACARPLRWFRPELLTCQCGAAIEASPGGSASPAVLQLMQVIQDKTRGVASRTDDAVAGLPVEWLNGISLRTLLRLVPALERLAERHILDTRETERLPGEVVAAALADWPAGFHATLRRAAADAQEGKSSGLRARLEQVYCALFRRGLPPDETAFLREAFLDFGRNEWGDAVIDAKLERGERKPARFASKAAVARKLGVRAVTVKRWVEKGVVPAKVVSAGTRPGYVIDTVDMDGLRRPRSERLGERAAARYLGVPVQVLKKLRELGAYSASPDVNGRQGYWRVDLERLRERLLAVGTQEAKEAVDRRDLLSMDWILRHSKLGTDDAKATFAALVLSGSIQPIHSDGESLRGILFLRADLEAFRTKHAAESRCTSLSIASAAELMRCGDHVVRELVRHNLIARSSPNGVGVSRASVDAFMREWMPLSSLARIGATSVPRLRRIAERTELKGFALPFRDGHMVFLRSEDIPRLMHEAGMEGAALAPGPTDARPIDCTAALL
jgi:hypothetical protein